MLPIPNGPCGLCGRTATLKNRLRSCVKVPNSPYALCSINLCVDVNQHHKTILFENVPLVDFMFFVFTRMLGGSYRRRLRSLLLCLYVTSFRALINSLVC